MGALLVTAGVVAGGQDAGPRAVAASSAGPSSSPSSSTSGSPPSTPASDAGRDAVESRYPVHPGARAGEPLVAFIGDSWTEGAGTTNLQGYAFLTGRELGWRYRVLGVGGSGYVRPGSGAPFGTRVDPAVAGNPDVVVIQGSVNERGTPTEELAPAVARTLDRLVEAAGPDTTVLVLGASYVPDDGDRDVDRVNRVVREAAAARGLRFVDVAAEGWTDPDDRTIWADSLHPNDRGARRIADRLAPLLRAVLAG